MRPILAFTAALLVGAPAYANTVTAGAYDYTEGCVLLNGDTLIAYGTAPIAFPRPIFSCSDSAEASPFPPEATLDPGGPVPEEGNAEVAEPQSPPGPGTGSGDPDSPGHVIVPDDVTVRPGDVLEVPEPPVAGLIGLGLAVFALRRKRGARAAR